MPLSTSRLDMKQISPYDKFSLEVDQQPKHTYLTLQHATAVDFYQECLQGKWYIRMINKADFSNCWFLLDFMHSNGTSISFQWPEKCYICWVPFQRVFCVIEVPSLVSGCGQYQMTAASARTVENAWLNYKC